MIDVKIRGDFLQVGGTIFNLRNVFGVYRGVKEKCKIEVYTDGYHGRDIWSFDYESEAERDRVFEQIASALELMGGQQDALKWEPGNEVHGERTEEDNDERIRIRRLLAPTAKEALSIPRPLHDRAMQDLFIPVTVTPEGCSCLKRKPQ